MRAGFSWVIGAEGYDLVGGVAVTCCGWIGLSAVKGDGCWNRVVGVPMEGKEFKKLLPVFRRGQAGIFRGDVKQVVGGVSAGLKNGQDLPVKGGGQLVEVGLLGLEYGATIGCNEG